MRRLSQQALCNGISILLSTWRHRNDWTPCGARPSTSNPIPEYGPHPTKVTFANGRGWLMYHMDKNHELSLFFVGHQVIFAFLSWSSLPSQWLQNLALFIKGTKQFLPIEGVGFCILSEYVEFTLIGSLVEVNNGPFRKFREIYPDCF